MQKYIERPTLPQSQKSTTAGQETKDAQWGPRDLPRYRHVANHDRCVRMAANMISVKRTYCSDWTDGCSVLNRILRRSRTI